MRRMSRAAGKWVLPAGGIDVSRKADNGLRTRGRLRVQQTGNKGYLAGMSLALPSGMRPTPRLILLVFLLLQVFDGILTYTAVAWLGVVSEGNALLAAAMHVAGAGPALVDAKTLAAGCGVLLYARGFYGVLGALT